MTDATSSESFTISEFCLLEKISRATFFKLVRNGLGPEVLRVAGTNIVRITGEARRAWHQRMADLNQDQAAALERQRRVEHASRAGRAAVKSAAHPCRRTRRAD